MCPIMILIHDCYTIQYDKRLKNEIYIFYFLNNIGCLVQGKLISTKSVLWCCRCKIHNKVAAPFFSHTLVESSTPMKKVCSSTNVQDYKESANLYKTKKKILVFCQKSRLFRWNYPLRFFATGPCVTLPAYEMRLNQQIEQFWIPYMKISKLPPLKVN